MLRTRQVTDNLSYNELLVKGLIPDLSQKVWDSGKMKTCKYPPCVLQTKDFSFFGVYMDFAVRSGLRAHMDLTVDYGTDSLETTLKNSEEFSNFIKASNAFKTNKNMCVISRCSTYFSKLMMNKHDVDDKCYDNFVGRLTNIIKGLKTEWNYDLLGDSVYYNQELLFDQLSGHPDIITNTAILDIKNTSGFKSICSSSCLQILTYYALSQVSNFNKEIKYIGFVFPMQKTIFTYDISNWDYRPFLDYLMTQVQIRTQNDLQIQLNDPNVKTFDELVNFVLTLQSNYLNECNSHYKTTGNTFHDLNSMKIGSHISKGRNIKKSIESYYQTFNLQTAPVQLFLSNPRTGKCSKITNKQTVEAGHFINSNNLRVYIHAPYVINLCVENDWKQPLLNNECVLSQQMNALGTIVHVGARKSTPYIEALDIMRKSVTEALDHCTKVCPLLLETPCGEGTEVLTTVEELSEFCKSIPSNLQSRLGLCIDTAHIFAAGYSNPVDYFIKWTQLSTVPVKLVHFNDSKQECGSKKDRHEYPGIGKIGQHKLLQVYDWCISNNVDMLYE